jgi:hypothetical protein
MMANLNDLYNQRNQFFKQKQDEAIGNVNAQNQQQQDALQRRFTSMGAANTGAAISAQQKQSEAAAAQTRQVQNDIAGQQAQANDVDIGRQFQSEEAQKGRDFSGREAQAGRDFSKGMSEQDMAFKQKIYDVEQQNKLKQMDLAERQFAMDKDAQAFNQRMAEIAAQGGEDPGFLGMKGIPSPQDMINPNPLKSTLWGKALSGAMKSDRGGIGIEVGGASCFLTTAACEAMQMPDDCWVLELARKFRDTYMVSTRELAGEIVEYYRIAPKIVESINAKENNLKIWKSLFWKNIIPFVNLVDDGDLFKAHSSYKDLISEAKKHLEVVGEK